MLEVDGVTVRYGAGARTVTAVDGVDLRLPDGEVLALLGPSGCGKSTLLRAVAGLEPLQAGRILMDGVDLARVPVHRRQFGLMFQDGVLFPHRTVAGNVGYGLRSGGPARPGMTRSGRSRRVEELLAVVGLDGLGGRRVDALSGGQQQRVALARALAPSPRLLLLDEPLAALDAALRERLLADLRTVLTDTGTTALFVTHDQQEAFAIADRVAVMRQGRVHQQGTPAEVWRTPVDAWVARFVGYSTVLPAGHGVAGLPDGPLALRPSALRVVGPAATTGPGPVAAVIASRPTPDQVITTVRIAELPPLQAVSTVVWSAGDAVRLDVDPAGTARLPAAIAGDGTGPSSGTVPLGGTVDR